MDFTPFLSRWRDHHLQAGQLLRDASLVLCVGHRSLLLALSSSAPERTPVLGAATTEAEGLRLVAQHQPRLLMVSEQLEQGSGSSLVLSVKRAHPAVKTLLIVARDTRRARLRAAIEAGCDGIVAESRLGQGAMIDAIRAIFGGGSYLDQQLRAATAAPELGRRPDLSRREREVLGLAMQGRSNQEIGRGLFLSDQTVKTHMTNVLRKLGARDRTHAVVLALRQGLVDFPPVEGCLG